MMWHYISADLRRIVHKQSFFGAVGAFTLLFAVMVFIYAHPMFTMEAYSAKTTSFLSFFPLIIGVFVFIAVYVDDFKCQSMHVAIGYGVPRSKIVLAKLSGSVILVVGVAVVVGVLVLITPVFLGFAPHSQQLMTLVLTVAAEMFRTIGYLAISALFVFFFQDGIEGVIAYVLLSTKTVYIVLSMILSQDFLVSTIGDWTRHLYTSQLYAVKDAMLGGEPFLLMLAAALLLGVVLPTMVAMIVFNKKELDF